jgi:hypothetical protein
MGMAAFGGRLNSDHAKRGLDAIHLGRSDHRLIFVIPMASSSALLSHGGFSDCGGSADLLLGGKIPSSRLRFARSSQLEAGL